MEEMSQQNRPADAGAPAGKWKRIGKYIAFGLMLLVACFWLALFGMAVRTGYLSRIGIAVGAIFVLSIISGVPLQLTGRKRLGAVVGGAAPVMMILAIVVGFVESVWLQGDGVWRPYRFDDVLAAIERKRAVSDEENAAHRYEAVFAMMGASEEPHSRRDENLGIPAKLERNAWRSEDHPQASEWLDSQAGAIEMLLEIGKLERCRWPVQADTYDEYTVPYKRLRRCTELLMAAGNRDLGEGRIRAALAKYLCLLRIADHIRQQPSKVDSMTGSVMKESACI